MITEEELKARLRRAFHEVASRPDLEEPARAAFGPHRPPRGMLVVAGMSIAAAVLVAVFVETVSTPVTRVQVKPAGVPPPPSGAPSAPPSDITGTEQTLETTAMPSFVSAPTAGRCSDWVPVQGTLHAFTVAGSPTFAVLDATGSTMASSCSPVPPPTSPLSSLVIYQLTVPTSGGFGIEGSPIPLEPSAPGYRPPVHLLASWPADHLQGYVWSHLPNGTAYVTYNWPGVQYWERPASGVAAFFMARPAVFDGPTYADWHTAPIPVMRAFDAQGVELGSVFAPRISGDDFVISTTPPPHPSNVRLPQPPP